MTKKRAIEQPNQALTIALYAVAGFGVALTTVTELSHHYPWILELCGGDTSGCADVASTSFARMFGVSVAYWGLLSYIAFIASLLYFPALTFPLAAALLGAEFYFLWVMASILKTYCLFCLIQFFTVIVLFALTVAWHRRREDFFLPGRLWSAPVVAAAVFAALVVPVQMRASSAPVGAGELITYTGPVDASLRVELYSDFECGFCRRFEPEIAKLVENHPDVLLVFRDFVIRSHKLSPVAVSYANGIAFTEGREAFVKTRREMFDHQPQLYQYLDKRLDKIEFTDALKEKIRAKVDNDMKRAASLGIHQTPTLVIYRGDRVVQVVQGFQKYEKFARFLKP